MAGLASTAGIALLCYIVYRIVCSSYRSRQPVRLARARSCEEPHHASGPRPGSMLYGWRRLRRMSEVVRSDGDILGDFFAEIFTKATTVKARQFDGSVDLLTIEPAKFRAMPATQFKNPSSTEEMTEETCKALISAIGPVDANRWTAPVDLQPLMFNFTLDTATAFLFGESVHSLSLGTEAGHEASTKHFLEDIELCSRYMVLRIRLQSLYWIVDGLKFRRALRRIQKFTERFVRKALVSPAERGAEQEKGNI